MEHESLEEAVAWKRRRERVRWFVQGHV
jgi:hypothetical protein